MHTYINITATTTTTNYYYYFFILSLSLSSGKTQLAHTLCVTSQLSYAMGGGQGKVIYVDTEGNFRSERIEAIAERFGLDVEQTLDNIIVARVFSHEEQMGNNDEFDNAMMMYDDV